MIVKICGMRDPENMSAVASLPINLMGFIFYEKSPRYVRDTSVPPAPAHVQRVGVFVNADYDFIVKKIKTHQLHYLQLHGDETPEYCRWLQVNITLNWKEEDAHARTLKEKQFISSLDWGKIKLIKAFRVNEDFDFSQTKKYEKYCAYFLFDTKKKKTNAVHPPTPSKGGDERVVPLKSGDEMKALSPKEEDTDARSFSRSEKQRTNVYPPLERAQGEEYGGTGKKFNWQLLQQYTGNTPFLLSGGIGAEDVKVVQNFTHPKFAGIDLNSKFELEPALKDVSKIKDFLNELLS